MVQGAERLPPNTTDRYYQDVAYLRHLANKAIFSPLPVVREQCLGYLIDQVNSDFTRMPIIENEVRKIDHQAPYFKDRATEMLNRIKDSVMGVPADPSKLKMNKNLEVLAFQNNQ